MVLLILYHFIVKTFFNYDYKIPYDQDTEYIVVNIPNDNNV